MIISSLKANNYPLVRRFFFIIFQLDTLSHNSRSASYDVDASEIPRAKKPFGWWKKNPVNHGDIYHIRLISGNFPSTVSIYKIYGQKYALARNLTLLGTITYPL